MDIMNILITQNVKLFKIRQVASGGGGQGLGGGGGGLFWGPWHVKNCSENKGNGSRRFSTPPPTLPLVG